MFIVFTRHASFMNMHKISLTNSSVVSWSSIKVYLWSKPRKRYLRKRKPGGRINIPLRAHKSSLLDTFVKVTCSTNKPRTSILARQASQSKRLLVPEAPRKYTCSRSLLTSQASLKHTCSRSVAKVYLLEKSRKRWLAAQASWKYTCSKKLPKVYLLHKPRKILLAPQASWTYTCSRSPVKIYLLQKPRTSTLAREAPQKITCARSLL